MRSRIIILSLITILSFTSKAILSQHKTSCQPGIVLSHTKISDTEGQFTGILLDGDEFSRATVIGDINNDGVIDLAVGTGQDNDGGYNRGAVWILFMNFDGTVNSHQKISDTQGGFSGILDDNDFFGLYISSLGDLNNDGNIDIAVGARGDDDGGDKCGAVWILFLGSNGTVLSHQKISATTGGLVGLTENRYFGTSLASIGDLDNDGNTELAVGSPNYDNDGGLYRGCVWILFLNSDGTVKAQQKINDYNGGFNVSLDDEDKFGYGIASIGDLDGDGINDITSTALFDDDGGADKGAVYIIFLNSDGTVKGHQKISATEGNFSGIINNEDKFGYSVTSLGDVNGDNITDICVGSSGNDDGGTNKGAVWILFLNADGTVQSHLKISDLSSDFANQLDNDDNFGINVSSFGDMDNDGNIELIVGTSKDDDGGPDHGAFYILDLCIGEPCFSYFSYLQTSGTTTFNFLDSSSTDIVSWYWDFGDGFMSTLQNPEYTYSNYGSYEVCLTINSPYGCIDTYCDSITTTLSNNPINQNENSISLLYPNPVTDRLNINLHFETNPKIKIFTITGAIVPTTIYFKQFSNGVITINTETLSNSIYILQIETDNNILHQKFTKQ